MTRCHQVDSQLGPPGLPESAKKPTLSVGSRSNRTAPKDYMVLLYTVLTTHVCFWRHCRNQRQLAPKVLFRKRTERNIKDQVANPGTVADAGLSPASANQFIDISLLEGWITNFNKPIIAECHCRDTTAVCNAKLTRHCFTLFHNTIRYDTRCAQKLIWVSLIYRTEPTTKMRKTEKLKCKNEYAKKYR